MKQGPEQWHRYFGLFLIDFFTGSPFVVELEKDLSPRQQLLDVIVLRKEPGAFTAPLPDGLEGLANHNLITYKSLREPLDAWAVDELMAHMVDYCKLVSPRGKLFPVGQLSLFVVSTRFPRELAAEVTLYEVKQGVYEVIWGVRRIKIVVLSEIADKPENAIWELFSTDKERVAAGKDEYKFRRPDGSTLINRLFKLYELEGIDMSYTWEDHQRDFRQELLNELTPEERLKGLSTQERLRGLPPEERLRGLSTEDLLRGLPPEEIEAYLRHHSKDKPGGS